MAKKHFLQKAHNLTSKSPLAGRLLSEKLDGMRFFWDGGASRGIPAEQVPYANVAKDDRYRNLQIATGLWSNYGKAIQAPDWWLDEMPPFPCEGELWCGYGNFQRVSSIVRSSVNVSEDDWEEVYAKIFDAPPPVMVFKPRHIAVPAADFKISKDALGWWWDRAPRVDRLTSPDTLFRFRYVWLQKNLEETPLIRLVKQHEIPFGHSEARQFLEDYFTGVVAAGGEGVIVKSRNDLWVPERVRSIMKYKPNKDDEGVVVGYKWGRKTDLGSKHLGKMGALILRNKNGVFSIHGFKDSERTMLFQDGTDATDYGSQHPGEEASNEVYNPTFPLGSVVTFRYRETTDDGIPKEARYWRKT